MIKNFNEFIFESENSNNLRFFFDMDGVLADFDKGLLDDPRSVELEAKKRDLFSYVESNLNKKVTSIDDVKPLLTSGDTELRRLYDLAHELVHEIAEEKDFFKNLEPMKGSREMLMLAKDISGKLPTILTAPVESVHSAPEKIQWMKDHFEGLYDDVIVDKEKHKYAEGPQDVLVDDRKKYVDSFRANGGSAILHVDPNETIMKMKTF